MKKTLYDWLEVSQNASPEVIEAAYQRLVLKMNPDNEENRFVPNALSNFNLVKEAYETLADPVRRRFYNDSLRRMEQMQTAPLPSSEELGRDERSDFLSSWSGGRVLGAALVALILVLVYQNHARNKMIEAAQKQSGSTMTHQREMLSEAEDRRLTETLRQEKLQEERQQRYDEERKTREARQQAEADRRYADRVSRELAAAEQAAKRDEERKAEQAARLERETRREEERNARRIQAENERKLRELDRKLMERR